MHNYILKQVRLFEQSPLPQGAYIAHVSHDDWCAFLSSTGECNCDPDIEFLPVLVDGKPNPTAAALFAKH